MALRRFIGSGSIWDGGDIPSCGYCGKDYDQLKEEGKNLYETCINGSIVCNSLDCTQSWVEGGDIVREEANDLNY